MMGESETSGATPIWRRPATGIAAGIAAVAAAAVLVTQTAQEPPAPADEGPAYKQVARFRVEYQDRLLGQVTGDAFCKWAMPDWGRGRDVFASGALYGSGVFGNSTEKQPHCRVRLYNPSTGEISYITAVGGDIREPAKPSDHLFITLHGYSPAAPGQPPVTGMTVVALAGAQAEITLQNGDTEMKFIAPIMQRAAIDDAMVVLDFFRDNAGSLLGSWKHYANMITERDAHGGGRVGTIVPQKDEDSNAGSPFARAGGFNGLERGDEMWLPLAPRIYAVHVMEDQAGFDKGVPKYSLNRLKDNANLNRTLVIFGRDLPVLDGEDFAGIRSKAPDGLSYTVIADSNDKNISAENKQRIAQARVEEKALRLPEDALELGTMDAVVVAVEQKALKEPGPRTFDWGGAQWRWTLQYGDNTAIARFVRIIRQNDYVSAPGSGEGTTRAQVDRYNSGDLRKREQRTADEARSAVGIERTQTLDESEQVTDLAMPDRVVVEVQTGAPLPMKTIPLVLGGEALGGKTIDVTATQLPDRPTLYRTDPIVFTATGVTPEGGGAGTVVPVAKGKQIWAKIDEGKTYFLRRGMATAFAADPASPWLKALGTAAACRSTYFFADTWQTFAKQTSETISNWTGNLPKIGVGNVDITYGDHAAMLILRQALLQSMRRNLLELTAISSEKITDQPADQLIDGWYRSAHDVVIATPVSSLVKTLVDSPAAKALSAANSAASAGPAGQALAVGAALYGSARGPATEIVTLDSPLAMFLVDSPAGKVPFAQAYSRDFELKTFHTDASPDGVRAFRQWRRQASLAALDAYRATVKKAIADDAAINECDRQALLTLSVTIAASSPRLAGGGRAPSLITSITPLLMKRRGPAYVSEPDFIARAYVDTIDQLAARFQAVNDYTSKLNKLIITAVATAAVLPAAFTLNTVTVVEVTAASIGETATAGLSISVSGLINFSYSAGSGIYDTYKSHADVAFAYAHYKVLGIDHYLDVQSQSQPWWKTIVEVFGDGVTNFARVGKAEVWDEGAMLQRGARVAEKMASIDAPLVNALADEDRAALALFMAKEEEFIAARGVATRAGKTSEDILGRLAARAAKSAGESVSGDAAAVRQKIEAAALAEIANPVAAGKAPLPSIGKGAAQAGLVADAEVAQLEDETKRAADLVNAPAPGANEIPKVDGIPFIGERRAYVVPGRNTFTAPGRPTVTAEIEGYVGAGEFAQVYKLKKVPEGLPVSLKPSLQGKKLVIKYIKKPREGKFTIPEYDEATDESISKELNALRSDTPQRLKHAEEVLEAAGQQGVPHAEFQVFAEDGFVIQELLEEKKDQLEFLSKLTKADFLAPAYDDRRKAVVALVKKLIDGRLEFHDFNPGNIYLEKVGDKWVAKILDADFINRFGEQRSAGAQEFYVYTLNTSVSSSPFLNTPLAAQMNIMERKGWLKFNGGTKVDQPGFLKPDDFKDIVDWPAFHPPPPPPPPPPIPLLDLRNLDPKQLTREVPSMPSRMNPKSGG